MVARDDLVQRARIRILFEDNKMVDQIEEPPPLEHPSDVDFEFQLIWVEHRAPLDRPPDLEPLPDSP